MVIIVRGANGQSQYAKKYSNSNNFKSLSISVCSHNSNYCNIVTVDNSINAF